MAKWDVELEVRVDVEAGSDRAAAQAAEALLRAEIQSQARISAAVVRARPGGGSQGRDG